MLRLRRNFLRILEPPETVGNRDHVLRLVCLRPLKHVTGIRHIYTRGAGYHAPRNAFCHDLHDPRWDFQATFWHAAEQNSVVRQPAQRLVFPSSDLNRHWPHVSVSLGVYTSAWALTRKFSQPKKPGCKEALILSSNKPRHNSRPSATSVNFCQAIGSSGQDENSCTPSQRKVC